MIERVRQTASRLSKLRAMSSGEVLSRLSYQWLLFHERKQHAQGLLAPAGRLERALDSRLRGTGWQQRLLAARRSTGARFYAGTDSRDEMRRLFDTRFQGERDAARVHASRARAGRIEFFGREFEYAGEIDWQADPESGARWPSVYHADVPRGGNRFGDIKYVWELNRHQFLIDLAKSYFLFEEDADRQALTRLVRSWIAGNPYATGVNWSCALEPAFRVFSWLWAYHLTRDGLDDDFHVEWLCAFHDHARFLERHLEHYTSPYNHLIGEATALFSLGVCFPEFEDARRWRETARHVLESRLDEQFYADGGTVEQSTFYHHATVGFYLLSAVLGRSNGVDLSPRVWRAIERGLEFSTSLMQPDGRIPEVGGADDGKPIRMEHLPFWDFRPYQALGAVLFGRPEWKGAAGRFYEDALWILGPQGLHAFDLLPSTLPEAGSVALPASGYDVLRNGLFGDADYLLFDCGEQAAGMRTDSVPNSMHGHADCLSVVAWLGGRRVLVDSGLYAYNCGGEWEAHFRETAAHNTVKVDGRDQAHHIGSMAWSHSYRAALEGRGADAEGSWVIGSHDGFARGKDGVTHRRAVWLRSDRSIVIYDEITGSADHDIEVNFQFAPGTLERGERTGSAIFDRVVDIVWTGSTVFEAEMKEGGPGPADGWIAPSLGVRRAAPRLTLTARMTEPRVTLLTVLAHRGGRTTPPPVLELDPQALEGELLDRCRQGDRTRG